MHPKTQADLEVHAVDLSTSAAAAYGRTWSEYLKILDDTLDAKFNGNPEIDVFWD